ncbi:MAG: glycosyltransferase family 4 protein [Crocinitomicaceae bacterium]|nr:glycosyltransferase family 4 protein [Crocinitomicaceae bacterium]
MNKRIIFIAPYPTSQAPSQRFRFEQYLAILENDGFQVEVHPFLSAKDWAPLYKKGSFLRKGISMLRSFARRFGLLFKLRKFDSIFIHREASMIGPPIFEFIIAKILRRKYIYDFDDAIWLPNYSESNAKFHKLKAYGKVKRIIKWADKICVGNEYLKNYAVKYNPNVQVIPTTIDLLNVHNQVTDDNSEEIIIGWTGSHTTMSYLPIIAPVLERLAKNFHFKFRVISNQPPSIHLENLEFIEWKKETEIEDLAAISIGIMPLKDNPWTQGKCGFKGLQYMALKIPSVLSNVGANKEIISHNNNGYLCDSEEEWYRTLCELIKNIELRKLIGENGYQTIKKNYSVTANKSKYLALFQ